MAVVRSPHAHARIVSVDLSAASAMPGVVAAFSGADLAGEWATPMPCAWPVTSDMQSPAHLPVAIAEACYVGDAVAVVLAASQSEAQDAAGAVVIDFEELPAALDLEDAASDRVSAHSDAASNRAYTWELTPDPDAVQRAFDGAAVTVKERYVQQRLIPAAMETRGVCVVPQPFGGEYLVYSSTQIPHILRTMLGITAGVPEERIRVVAPSVGGGFGSKLNVYAEELLCLALARRVRKPVRWSEERSEAASATIHGRGQIQEIELAADSSGRVQAVRVHLLADMGAYLQLVTPGFLFSAPSCTTVATTCRLIPSRARASSPTRRRPTPTAAQAAPRRPMRSSERSTPSHAKSGPTPPMCEGTTSSLRTSFPIRPQRASCSTAGATTTRWTRLSSSSTTRACERSRPACGPRGGGSCSGSVFPRTSRCAGSRPLACLPPSITWRGAGRRPPCGCCRRGRCKSSRAPRRTARATRRAGR